MAANMTNAEIKTMIEYAKRFVYTKFKTHPAVNDFIDDVPYVIALSMPKYDPQRSPNRNGFFITCVTRYVLSRILRLKRRREVEEEYNITSWTRFNGDPTTSECTDVFDKYELLRFREEFANLPSETREMIISNCINGEEQRSIAARYEISNVWVSETIRRGITTLRKRMLKNRRMRKVA